MELVSINTLSNMLEMSESTIRYYILKNYIPYVKLGKLIRFDKEAINKWIKDRTVKAIDGGIYESSVQRTPLTKGNSN